MNKTCPHGTKHWQEGSCDFDYCDSECCGVEHRENQKTISDLRAQVEMLKSLCLEASNAIYWAAPDVIKLVARLEKAARE